MAWVRIDDQAPRNVKLVAAGPSACWLWVCAIAYCQSQLTDGFVAESVLSMIGIAGAARCKRLAGELVKAGLFEAADGGYLVHDYHDYNETREQALQRRTERHDAKVKAGQAGAAKRWQTDSRPIADGNSRPIAPSHPIPSHPIPQEKKVLSSADADFEAFRAAYPVSRRVGGKPGKAAFQRSGIGRHGDSLATVLLALEQQKRSEQWRDPKLIPLMTTWLNQERWIQVLPEQATRPGVLKSTEFACPHLVNGVPQHLGRNECHIQQQIDAARAIG